MFELVRNPKFDFMSLWRVCFGVSAALMLAALVALSTVGLNLGVEFSGGTELQLKYSAEPDIPAIRAALERGGIENAAVTRIGEPEEREVYIRLGGRGASEDETEAEDPTSRVVAALRGSEAAGQDLNLIDRAALERLLASAADVSGETAQSVARAILERRREMAIFSGASDLADVPGMTPELSRFLESQASFGPLAVRSQSYIGPTVGRELAQKAAWAILGSLAGMLAYIWVRFRFEWGLAAVIAVFHDALITLGLVAVLQKEVSLPVVAAFLTLIGFSVNDTVVIFDRVRENLTKKLPGETFTQLVNRSINQTLSRTLITNGLTWLSCFGLWLFGGPALEPFSFVLTMGIVIGTYSTMYIASPVLLLWQRYVKQRPDAVEGEPSPAAARARKVRAGTPS